MTRAAQLTRLQGGEVFDLLVVGGGATGLGIAVDAASRGLTVALVEKNDFAEGTSSRSTKLAHGGVRYLEKAVKHLDRAQYALVREGLRERALLLSNAPHLAHRIAFVTPLYRWRDIPYVYAGLCLYDLLAGRRRLGRSRLLGRREALRRFPTLKAAGLKAAVSYYDGQFHDARMAVALAQTARQQGAVVANHVAVEGLRKEQGRLVGAQLVDRLSASRWEVRARCIVNATGPFCDRLRALDNPQSPPIVKTSSGIHLVLDQSFAPKPYGLMIPQTEDGRVLFLLPWEGHTLVGTTDTPAPVQEHPWVSDAEIDYVLRHVRQYCGKDVQRSDVKAAWSGLRPLVADPAKADTQSLVRDHLILTSASGLVSISGGKWTSYRRMAEDLVDRVVRDFTLPAKRVCLTRALPVVGSEDYDDRRGEQLAAEFALPPDVASHLARSYGSRAPQVARLCQEEELTDRLHPQHPYLEGEVVYAVRQEMAERAIDILARRLSLALLDRQAALAALPRVLALLQQAHGWDDVRKEDERVLAEKRLTKAL